LLCFKNVNQDQSKIRIRFKNEETHLKDLWSYIDSSYNPGSLEIEELQEDYYIFVCSHENKDNRCGYCGPIIADEFQNLILKQGVKAAVHKISHVGKHEFAANVITYPYGDWYGYVKPKDVPRIMDGLSSRTPHISLGDIWRGGMGKSKEEQMRLCPVKPQVQQQQQQQIKTLKRKDVKFNPNGFGTIERSLDYLLWLFFLFLSTLCLPIFY